MTRWNFVGKSSAADGDTQHSPCPFPCFGSVSELQYHPSGLNVFTHKNLMDKRNTNTLAGKTGMATPTHRQAIAQIRTLGQPPRPPQQTPTVKRITDLIGNTPILVLSNYAEQNGLQAILLGKLEFFNPGGSVKARTAIDMLDDAEKKGLIKAGTTLIEPTSGNTGIGLAMIAMVREYRLILTMPETMTVERRKLLKAYGAEIVLTEGEKGMRGAIDKAAELLKETPNSFSPSQFENPANPEGHHQTTGPEIWHDTGGNIDYFVSTVGTGGTITGVGEFLKSMKPNLKVVAVEPAGSPMLSKGISGPHEIQGIGTGFIPKTLNTKIYDEVIAVKDEDAFASSRMIARTDGLFVGTSSGAALWAAAQIAKRPEASGKTIVMIFPDTGERYLSTTLFE